MGGLLGRGDELASFSTALASGRSVAVVGPAGIGKTTQLRAGLEGIEHRWGAGLSVLRARPYAALEQAVRARLDGQPAEVAGDVLAALGDAVLVIEDLHWVDDSTHEVLELLRGRARLVLTSRPPPSERTRSLVEGGLLLELCPLPARASERLARDLHPQLAPEQRRELLALAAGNPLLIERLVDADGVTPSLRAALASRLATMSAAERHMVGLLALLGRPVEPGLFSERASGHDELIAVDDAGRLVLRHAALAATVVELLDERERLQLHAELAQTLGDAEGAAHALAAGDARSARVKAERATADAPLMEQGDLLHLAAKAAAASGCDPSALQVRAAGAYVDAGRWREAIAEAELLTTDDPVTAAGAAFERGRARWYLGDVAGARDDFALAGDLAGPVAPTLSTRALVERAYLEVRDRLQGSRPLAEAALSAAESAGVEVLRARSALGAALLYEGRPEWETALRDVIEDADRAGDEDVRAAAAYHLVSGLGFHGRLREAVQLGEREHAREATLGRGTWVTQFRVAHLVQRAIISHEPARVAEDAASFLRERRLYRNRGQAHLAVVLALLDLGRFEEAAGAVERFEADSPGNPESTVQIAAAEAELAWHLGDVERARHAIIRGRRTGDAWFGLRLLVERTAMYVLVDADVPFEAELPSFAMPAFWPAIHEIDGLSRLGAGDLAGAAVALQHAADDFEAMAISRWAVRAGIAAADAEAARGNRAATARRRRYVDLARRAGLAGTLRRLGLAVRAELTPTEESVLRQVAQGGTTREIATNLGIAVGTVDQHIESARRKLGAATRLEAARMVGR